MSFRPSRPQPLMDLPAIALITPATTQEIEAARAIFRDYGASLQIDLGFQQFEEELAGLPGEYVEPRGALLLALVDRADADCAARCTAWSGTPEVNIPEAGTPCALLQHPASGSAPARSMHVAGCCALRPLDETDHVNAAEMKRLYVRPAFRGLGLGRRLTEAVLDAARMAGYSCVLLDTLDDMEAARALYEEMGFFEVPPYYHNPIAGAHYLKVDL